MFMKPQIIWSTFVEINDRYMGAFFIPEEDYSPEEGEIKVATHFNKYGARFSASGYLDCTDWYIFDTRKEAEEYIATMQLPLPCEEELDFLED